MPRSPLPEVPASQMEQVTVALQIGQFHCPQTLRQRWIKRILQSKFHHRFVEASKMHSAEPFITEEELAPFLQDIRDSFPSVSIDVSILPHQPFRLHLLHTLLLLAEDPDSNIALLLQQGIPSGAFSQIQPAGIWAPNTKPLADFPDLQICEDNWSSANQDPSITAMLIQNEINNGFIEEIPDLQSAEARWPLGIALGKLGVVHADNRDPRLVLDSTICGMNGRCFTPEKQRLPNIRHISWFLSSCPPLQDEWQGASIDIKAAHKRMLIREDERGSLLFRFQGRLFAYRSAHFGAKTSAWHWGRVSAFFFYCIAELAIKPCRSSRSNTRGGFEKFHDTCKTGNKNTTKQTKTPKPKNQNTNTKDRRQVSLDGETGGEKRVKRPKLPKALMC